nr:pyridoxal phosphate-dependent aminotransferase [Candidatus Sigynarchaeum springense]
MGKYNKFVGIHQSMVGGFSRRVSDIQPFIVMELLARAQELERKGTNIVHMEIGEPDFDTPEAVRDAAIKGCQAGKTHYTNSLGYRELREAISRYKKDTRGLDLDVDREIMVIAGTSPGFLMAMGALVDPGDEVIVTDPGYPCYQNFIRFFGGVPKFVKIHEEERFELDPAQLEQAITGKTRMILLNSPANPTGQAISEKALRRIADVVLARKDVWVLADEIYAELTYTGKIAPSISSIPEMRDRTIVLDGFSKMWAMTGWRLGYIVAPGPLMKAMDKINQNFMICAPSVSQEAAIAALGCSKETAAMLRLYKQRRDVITKRINQMQGISMKYPPSGAFYAFANIKAVSNDSLKFAYDLLEKGHVAATPGIGFGANGEGFIRFSYTTDVSNIAEAMDRVERFLGAPQR